jgi:hypothetical protein
MEIVIGLLIVVLVLYGLLSRKKPWWKDKKKGWPHKGVRDFFQESERHAAKGDINTAIEILEWGIRFSNQSGSGGGAQQMREMIKTLKRHR